MWHDKVAGKSHAGEGKRDMWHDKVAGKSHAGEGKRGIRHDKVAGKSHAGEGKRGMLHDKIAGKSHAGEGKRDMWHDWCGDKHPGRRKKQVLQRCKETPPRLRRVGRTLPAIELLTGVNKTGSYRRKGKERTPEEGKSKKFRGELSSQREEKHPGRRKRQEVQR